MCNYSFLFLTYGTCLHSFILFFAEQLSKSNKYKIKLSNAKLEIKTKTNNNKYKQNTY